LARYGRRLVVLHVFIKKTQATLRKAIETARNRPKPPETARIRLENAA
jgi:phage-related protein